MNRYYYTKSHKKNNKTKLRFLGLGMSLIGLAIVLFIFTPLVSWQIIYAPIFDQQMVIAPVPHTTLVDPAAIKDMLMPQANANSNTETVVNPNNDNDAKSWFPSYNPAPQKGQPKVFQYTVTIPKIKVTNAIVSAVDNDLSLHMVNFSGTATPPEKGTAVVFGHSTLPQLYDPNNYKTILANAYQLAVGDNIIANVGGVDYEYKIFSITIIDPTETDIVFTQNYDDSYFTLVTCTPPGTIWKRLVVKARLQKI